MRFFPALHPPLFFPRFLLDPSPTAAKILRHYACNPHVPVASPALRSHGSTGAREPPVFFALTGGIGRPPTAIIRTTGRKELINDFWSRTCTAVRVYVLPAHGTGTAQFHFLVPPSKADQVSLELYVTQRITWMPRLSIPMKDVASCDKLRSAARQALPAEDVRMGKPLRRNGLRSRLKTGRYTL